MLTYRVSKWVRAVPALFEENRTAFPIANVYLYALRHS
jgi:hypothetical protein